MDTRTSFVASLRDMNPAELDQKIQKLRAAVFVERPLVEMYGMGYSKEALAGSIRSVKRDLARALTVQRERRRAS